MFRKFFAILATIVTLWVIKETYYIFTTNDIEIAANRAQLKIVCISVVLPLMLLTFWLWRPKPKSTDTE